MSALPSMPVLSPCGGALIASPSRALREQVLHRLSGLCRPIQQVHGGADALAKLEKGGWQVLFLDRRLPDLDAEELIAIIEQRFPGIRVVLLDSDSDGTMADADSDAESVLSHDIPHLVQPAGVSEAGTHFAGESQPGQSLPGQSLSAEPLPQMIGSSEPMQQVYRLVRLVARRPTTVLIAGATGTGKELVARALHLLSPRAAKPLVVVNCAAIPEALLESELYGYSRGAFTGAVQAQVGRIAAAQGGTLFLDEVSELPLGMQAKLLRFLEQKEIQRLGASEVTRVDVRVVAASNADLARRALKGEFRQDLYYRLAAFPIQLPPLAERRADIIPLAEHFLACMAAAMQTPAPRLGPAAIRMLAAHSWTGNVRELQHVMERASILAEDAGTVEAEHLLFSFSHDHERSES
jgi:DNA-binding NtrC family response regulator